MTGVVLRGLPTRKLRAVLTAIAIVLGVAMISGTYVLMDTTMNGFDSLFTTAYSKSTVVVVGKSPIARASDERAARVGRACRADSRAASGQGRPGVRRRQGGASRRAGGAITGPGARWRLACRRAAAALNTLELVAGHWPSGPGQIALDAQTARANHFHRLDRRGRHTPPARVVPRSRARALRRRRSLGPIELLVFDLPARNGCSTSRASTTRSTSPPARASAPSSSSRRSLRCCRRAPRSRPERSR